MCSHFPVKAFRVWIGRYGNFVKIVAGCFLHRVDEQFLSHTGTDVGRRHPHVIQLGFLLPNYQSVEAYDLTVVFSDKDLIGGHKIR